MWPFKERRTGEKNIVATNILERNQYRLLVTVHSQVVRITQLHVHTEFKGSGSSVFGVSGILGLGLWGVGSSGFGSGL